jgi:4-hydroxysphinganine ceramide fatty acyl 2-hydroxylase
VVGIVGWTLFEYLMHRFLFHSEDYLPENKIFYMAHFLLHGIHHAFPSDPLRLVFPITLGYLILLLMVLPMLNSVIPVALCPSFKMGFILGYIIYDDTHWFIHHSSPKEGYFKSIKLYHM